MLTMTNSIEEHRDLEVNPRSGKRVDEEVRTARHARPVCADCRRRPAITCIRGRHVVLDDHDLCRQCWRTRMDSGRATKLARRTHGGRAR